MRLRLRNTEFLSSRVSPSSRWQGASLTLVAHPSSNDITINMFKYVEQLCTPSFHIGLVKFESGSSDQLSWTCVIRSVETDIGRWALVIAVINVDAYPFVVVSISDLSPSGYRNRYFLVAVCCLIVMRKDKEVTTKRLLH